MGQALFRVLFAGPLLAACLYWLYLNERQVVEQVRELSWGQSLAVSTSAETVDPSLEGQLIHVSARAEAPGEAGVLQDPLLGITAKGLRLKREVRMYQWKERAETRQKRSGTTSTSTTVYHYDQVWALEHLDSPLLQVSGHKNPPLPLRTESFDSPKVLLGAYRLSKPFVWMLEHWTPLPLEASVPESVSPGFQAPVQLHGPSTLYVGKDPRNPRVGDLSISYLVAPPATVTVVGRQVKGFIERYEDPRTNGFSGLVLAGQQPLESFFTRLQGFDLEEAWPPRALGCLFVFMILLAFAALLPAFTGPLSDGQMLCSGLLLCVPVSVLPLGLAWFDFKPVLGVGLMGGGGLGIYGALLLLRRWARPSS
jgi:hypothetical protein